GSPIFRTPMASSSASTTTPKNRGRGQFRIIIDRGVHGRILEVEAEAAWLARGHFGSMALATRVASSSRDSDETNARPRKPSPSNEILSVGQVARRIVEQQG